MMKTQQSEKLFERSKSLVPGGVHSPVRAFRGVGGTPRFMRSASGTTIEDVDGNSYTDFCMSWGPLLLGHRDPDVLEAVQAALLRGWSYGTVEPYSLELVELITQSIPWVEKIRFVNSGTEAVMAALRLARAATGRNLIIKFDGTYHGHVDSMLVRAGSGLAEQASPDSAGVSKNAAAETIVIPLNDLGEVEKVLALRGSEVAAVIMEAIPANNGLLLQHDDFLQKLFKITKAAGSLFILDEVITGFRVGFGGMAERAGIRPDLVTYGKIIGGGFPVGAYGGRQDLMDLIAPTGPVYQAGTLSANPIAMVAGLATLKKLKNLNPYHALELRTEHLARTLEKVGSDLGFPVRVQNYSSIFWTIFGELKPDSRGWVRTPQDTPEEHKSIYSKIFHSALEQGIYLAPSAFEVSFLSTQHTEADLEKLAASLKQGILQAKL